MKLRTQPTTVRTTYMFETSEKGTKKAVEGLLARLSWIDNSRVESLTADSAGTVWTLVVRKA